MEYMKKLYQRIILKEEDSFYKIIITIYMVSIVIFSIILLIFRKKPQKYSNPRFQPKPVRKMVRPVINQPNYIVRKRYNSYKKPSPEKKKYPVKFKISSLLT